MMLLVMIQQPTHAFSVGMQDAPFMELFHKLYHTPEWVDGSATASILATLNDYFQDYEHFVEPSNFKR